MFLRVQPFEAGEAFPFKDHFFNVTVLLMEETDEQHMGHTLPLRATLVYADDGSEVPDAESLMELGGDLAIGQSGMCVVRCKVRDVSMNHANRAFALKVIADLTGGDGDDAGAGAGGGGGTGGGVKAEGGEGNPVKPAFSPCFTVINHRLVITGAPIDDKWFKDEGGREKCLMVHTQLYDASGPTGGRQVRLRATLCYEDGRKVNNQGILKSSPDTKFVTDAQGKALVKVRIEDVSKNHQNQSFRVKISADTTKDPLNHDISSCHTNATIARSKVCVLHIYFSMYFSLCSVYVQCESFA